MMTYGKKKSKFTHDIALLIQEAERQGYEIRFCPEHPRHMSGSLHFIGLAKDFELFKDGVYLTRTEDYATLGTFWESLGNTWGGRFGDGNHFSISHEGKK